jgi:DNA-directed RNA polymerase specialized sigma24 family protein
MRRLLIQHSRPLWQRMSHVELDAVELRAISNEDNPQLVEELLSGLEAIDPRMRSVVELGVFEGMTNEEIAGQLGCSSRSVQTYWSFARR